MLRPLFESIADVLAWFNIESQMDWLRTKFERAGSTSDRYAETQIARVVLAGVFGGLGWVIGMQMALPRVETIAAMTALVGWVVGFMLIIWGIDRRIARRRESVRNSLPDAVDLLVIAVEAGLGFDMAMGKVYEKWDNELSLGFGRVLREIQLGKLRRQALRDLAERYNTPDFTAFTASIIQADQLGVSMARILRVQSDQLRVGRRQRLQEEIFKPISSAASLSIAVLVTAGIVLWLIAPLT